MSQNTWFDRMFSGEDSSQPYIPEPYQPTNFSGELQATLSLTPEDMYNLGYTREQIQHVFSQAQQQHSPSPVRGGYPGNITYPPSQTSTPMHPRSQWNSVQQNVIPSLPTPERSVFQPTSTHNIPLQGSKPPPNISLTAPPPEATPPPPIKENTPAKPENKTKAKTGAGARSGKNHRANGGSDDEVEKLSSEVKAGAELKPIIKTRGLSDEDKENAVRYITRSDIWEGWRLKKLKIFIYIAQTLLEARVSTEQVRNYWETQAWPKYKACVQRSKHTGGGDGDNDRYVVEDVDGEADGVPKKRKKSNAKAKTGDFSMAVLDAFEASEIFTMIDAVAHDDETVKRILACDSAVSCLTDDEDNESDEEGERERRRKRKKGGKHQKAESDASDTEDRVMIQSAIETVKQKAKISARIEEERLKIEMRWEERAEEERTERLALARKQDAREAEKHRASEWERAMKMLESPVSLINDMGKKLLQKLGGEEGL